MERVVAGLQQRKVVSEKERRILAFHEGGHALMSHLMGEAFPVHKATIVSRGDALGYTLHLPEEDRYLHTKEEFIDYMKIVLAGRAAEQIVFGRVTNGAANDLQKVTDLARSMVFEFGMSDVATSRTMRADNYALSEETKRMRDSEQARLTDQAYAESVRLLQKHRPALDKVADCADGEGDARPRPVARALRRRRARVARGRVGRRRARRPGGRRHVRPRRPPLHHLAARSIGRVQARQIHHLGVAVRDLEEAFETYARLFGAELEHRETLDAQGVEAIAIMVGDSRVELLGALGEDTPVGRFLAKRGPGMHHVAYEVDDVSAALADLAREGAQLIDEVPRRGLYGLQVAFVHPDSVHGVLAEVVSDG